MLSGRTANGALAEVETERFLRVQAFPTLISYSRKLVSGPALGIATVEDRQSRFDLLVSPNQNFSVLKTIRSSYPAELSGPRIEGQALGTQHDDI